MIPVLFVRFVSRGTSSPYLNSFTVIDSLLLLASSNSASDPVDPVAFVQLKVIEFDDPPKCPSRVTNDLLSPVHDGIARLLSAHVVGHNVIRGCSWMVLSHVVECFPSGFIRIPVDLQLNPSIAPVVGADVNHAVSWLVGAKLIVDLLCLCRVSEIQVSHGVVV